MSWPRTFITAPLGRSEIWAVLSRVPGSDSQVKSWCHLGLESGVLSKLIQIVHRVRYLVVEDWDPQLLGATSPHGQFTTWQFASFTPAGEYLSNFRFPIALNSRSVKELICYAIPPMIIPPLTHIHILSKESFKKNTTLRYGEIYMYLEIICK